MRITIDYGIDLGTTNSTIACFRGIKPILLKSSKGISLMPSAVHITSDGNIITGLAAKKLMDEDPQNTAIEFKRIIGTKEPIHFSASGKSFKPEELSSFILKRLLKRVEEQDGYIPKGVVITIPAMFQLPQCEATKKAAQLAGIKYAPLLQEPIAAAIAHAHSTNKREGYWLIYDLGGGTFDVSLVRSKEGRLQVLDHDGDNHLGGKDLDRLVAQEAVQIIRTENLVKDFKRSNPLFTEAFAKLKAEAERIRIYLSEKEQVTFSVQNLFTQEDNASFDFEMDMNRDKLESIIEKIILRTTKLCKEVLIRNRLIAKDLNGVVMVGGPTLTPCLPKIIERELAIEAKHYVDPMNIVAFGAAIFASTQKLPKEFRQITQNHDTPIAELLLEFEAMTTNPNPLLVGRLLTSGNNNISHIRLRRADKQFETEKIALNHQKAFFANLLLQLDNANLFNIELLDEKGVTYPSNPSQITILHGLSVGAPPLSQSVGIMLADNSVAWYLKKGVALPVKNKQSHATTVLLKRGQSGEAINVPVIQGESERADRNKVIGILKIFAEDMALNLPVGSEIQVELSIDEFSNTKTRAYVPLLDQWFEDVVQLDIDAKTVDAVHQELGTQMDRLDSLSKLADQLNEEDKVGVNEQVKDIESLIEEGDRDSIDVADQMLRKMTQKLDQTEDQNHQQNLNTDFKQLTKDTQGLLQEKGSNDEKQLFQALEKEFNLAIKKDDVKQAEQKKKEINDLFMTVYARTDEFWASMFLNISKTITENKYGGNNGKVLVQEGMRALNNGQLSSLRQICYDLIKMLPQEEQKKIDGVVSTVI